MVCISLKGKSEMFIRFQYGSVYCFIFWQTFADMQTQRTHAPAYINRLCISAQDSEVSAVSRFFHHFFFNMFYVYFTCVSHDAMKMQNLKKTRHPKVQQLTPSSQIHV